MRKEETWAIVNFLPIVEISRDFHHPVIINIVNLYKNSSQIRTILLYNPQHTSVENLLHMRMENYITKKWFTKTLMPKYIQI